MSEHSKLMSPSAGKRWINCTASQQAILDSGIVDEAGEAAARGTLQHHYSELVMKGEYDPELGCPEDLVQDNETFEWTEVLDAVAMAKGSLPLDDKAKVWYEMSVQFPEEWRSDCFGTADIVLLHAPSKTLYIYDYKFGRGRVSVEMNTQLLIYATAVVRSFANKIDINKYVETIELGIIQPKLNSHSPFKFQISLEDLKLWDETTLEPAQRVIVNGVGELKAGNWCQDSYCPLFKNHKCEVALKKVEDTLEAFTTEILAREKPAESGVIDGRYTDLLALKPFVEKFLKNLMAKATSLALTGEKISGHKLVRGRGSRAWLDDKKADTFLKNKRIPKAERFTEKLLSPFQAEQKLKALGVLKATSTKNRFESLYEKKEGSLVLVPEDDSRKECSVAPIDELVEEMYPDTQAEDKPTEEEVMLDISDVKDVDVEAFDIDAMLS